MFAPAMHRATPLRICDKSNLVAILHLAEISYEISVPSYCESITNRGFKILKKQLRESLNLVAKKEPHPIKFTVCMNLT